jgi:hypothetical protein
MAKWSNELETEIRDLGEYVDKQMKDLLNPEAGVNGSALRIAFRHAFEGKQRLDNILRYDSIDYTNMGLNPRHSWTEDLKMLSDLADENMSTAGEKIKKALAVVPVLEEAFKTAGARGLRPKIRVAKSLGLPY